MELEECAFEESSLFHGIFPFYILLVGASEQNPRFQFEKDIQARRNFQKIYIQQYFLVFSIYKMLCFILMQIYFINYFLYRIKYSVI